MALSWLSSCPPTFSQWLVSEPGQESWSADGNTRIACFCKNLMKYVEKLEGSASDGTGKGRGARLLGPNDD